MRTLILVFENLSDENAVEIIKKSTAEQLLDIQLILEHTSKLNQKRWKKLIQETLNIGGNAK